MRKTYKLILWFICLFTLPNVLWSQEVQLSDFKFMEGKWTGEFEYFRGEGIDALIQVPVIFEFKIKKGKAKYRYTYLKFKNGKTQKRKWKLLVKDKHTVTFEKKTYTVIKSKKNDIMIQREGDFNNQPANIVRQFILKDKQLLITMVITKNNDSFLNNKFTLQK